MSSTPTQWRFSAEDFQFSWDNPAPLQELYFPVCNEAGMMGCVSPRWQGDLKTGQSRFLMEPVSIENLHDRRGGRNFWIYEEGQGAWSAAGHSALELAQPTVERKIEGGFLWHRLACRDSKRELGSSITTFAPASPWKVEISMVEITNHSAGARRLIPTSSTPVYGRSAENIRDHRHVTSLVNRVRRHPWGLTVRPEIIFDERGHRESHWATLVAGVTEKGTNPKGVFGRVREYIGAGGTLDWPAAVVKNIDPAETAQAPLDGMECAGALRFEAVDLGPGESARWVLLTAALDSEDQAPQLLEQFGDWDKAGAALKANQEHWKEKLDRLAFEGGPDGFAGWARWVGLQPMLRKIYGCSFLPHHDYGKGGRGWRDLWQDCLSLVLQEPENAESLLRNNFKGVRADGSNATIIGAGDGEFIADRNSISRVWMDHGLWPLMTTRLYVDQSGDYALLLKQEPYFRDPQIRRARGRDESWTEQQGNQLRDAGGKVWMGSILEHLLVQHLTVFFNVGEHNRLLLEGADWNDTLDMARTRGESVAFSAAYAGNLQTLARTIDELAEKEGKESLEVFEELGLLLDRCTGHAVDYEAVDAKRGRLDAYFDKVSPAISGKRLEVSCKALAADLRAKAAWLSEAIRLQEWVDWNGGGFFNGYYNEDGEAVGGLFGGEPRFYLTSQVFPIMAGVADQSQCEAAYEACRKVLKDPVTGGYRLNTPLGPNRLNFGRGFAFAFGEKENGAVFSHMVVMFMNALYRRGLVRQGWEVFQSLFALCQDTPRAEIYPGLPEYFNAEGRGLYHYLTGSASWMMLTLLTEMFGLKGKGGDLIVQPRLVAEQFENGPLAVQTLFRGYHLRLQYTNPECLDWGRWKIKSLSINGKQHPQWVQGDEARVPSEHLKGALDQSINLVEVELGA